LLLAQVDVEELEERYEREQRELEEEIDSLRAQLERVERASRRPAPVQSAEPDWRMELRQYQLKSVPKEKADADDEG
jgi:hypothetical protein